MREQNEDSIYDCAQDGTFIVADGVGGNAGGQVASQLAVQTLERRLRLGDSLESAFVAADMAINNASIQNDCLKGMASTAVILSFKGCDFSLAWVGDSRAYQITTGSIVQLSRDHNVVNELLEKGEISSEEALCHPGHHELTQALGHLSLNNIPVIKGRLRPGEMLLLCSDGLSGVLSDAQILHTILVKKEPERSLKSLLDQVLDAGAPDNVSMILVKNAASFSEDKEDSELVSKKFVRSPPVWVTGLVILFVMMVMLIMIWFD